MERSAYFLARFVKETKVGLNNNYCSAKYNMYEYSALLPGFSGKVVP